MIPSHVIYIILCSLLGCHSFAARDEMCHPRGLIYNCHYWNQVHQIQAGPVTKSILSSCHFWELRSSIDLLYVTLLSLTHNTAVYKIPQIHSLSSPVKSLPDFIQSLLEPLDVRYMGQRSIPSKFFLYFNGLRDDYSSILYTLI